MFLVHWQPHFLCGNLILITLQTEFASDIEVATAITGEDLRSTDAWSIIYCENNSTAAHFRAFRNKSMGSKKRKVLRGSISPPQCSLYASWWDRSKQLLPPSHFSFHLCCPRYFCILSLSLLNPLSLYPEALDAPLTHVEQVCKRLDGHLTTPSASSL